MQPIYEVDEILRECRRLTVSHTIRGEEPGAPVTEQVRNEEEKSSGCQQRCEIGEAMDIVWPAMRQNCNRAILKPRIGVGNREEIGFNALELGKRLSSGRAGESMRRLRKRASGREPQSQLRGQANARDAEELTSIGMAGGECSRMQHRVRLLLPNGALNWDADGLGGGRGVKSVRVLCPVRPAAAAQGLCSERHSIIWAPGETSVMRGGRKSDYTNVLPRPWYRQAGASLEDRRSSDTKVQCWIGPGPPVWLRSPGLHAPTRPRDDTSHNRGFER